MLTQSPAFGADEAPEQTTYQQLAAQVRAMHPRALSPQSYDDVLTLIEYLQEETTRQLDELTRRGNEVAQREKELAAAQRTLKLKQRAVDAIVKQREGRGWIFWRR
jgi:hypothetical protein